MGCDIHFYVERYTNKNAPKNSPKSIAEIREDNIDIILGDNPESNRPSRWITVDEWELDDDDDDDFWRVVRGSSYYNGRDYSLFSKLADVRTYLRSDAKNNIIEQPRGIPTDASYSYKYICDKWDGEAYSHSYFTLTELLLVDWESNNFNIAIENMRKIDEDTDNVRCCFFFDN